MKGDQGLMRAAQATEPDSHAPEGRTDGRMDGSVGGAGSPARGTGGPGDGPHSMSDGCAGLTWG